MAVTITVRNVPDDVRDELAARAARSGRSLQEYLSAELHRLATTPSAAEAIARARLNAQSYPSIPMIDIVDAARVDRP
ncbi:FitA-like ribbon-helix-helix domain-containing protein [Microbacterium sp. bgisy203]|uniref:FitA-like ribbon-helix-helix domain-containing protein n=1 Tax=Microbacterium sp. bgisy203 TaxID=3413799 RepID=UPI003D7387A2